MTTHEPPEVHEPRAVCTRCWRPARVCYCAHLPRLETRTRVVLLQHPRERRVPIGTAHMASLCLPSSELHVGVDWEGSKELARALSDPARPAALLWPGEGAIDVVSNPPAGPITLVVVDGTWWQARNLVRRNPTLARLPRYAFAPAAPSEYRIRREPDPSYVSTIEALMHVLGALEGDPDRFRALLAPFRAMVDAQLACKGEHGASRHKKARGPRVKGPRVPRAIVERARDLVCVIGEANAWPYNDARRTTHYPDELVQWVAHRPSTGETFEGFAAPRNPLAKMTPVHLDVPAAELVEAAPLDDLLARWRAFLREDDVVCSWGHYAPALFAKAGGALPRARVDVRAAARLYAKGKVGSIEDFLASAKVEHVPAPLARGRAGRRVAELAAIVRHLGRAVEAARAAEIEEREGEGDDVRDAVREAVTSSSATS